MMSGTPVCEIVGTGTAGTGKNNRIMLYLGVFLSLFLIGLYPLTWFFPFAQNDIYHESAAAGAQRIIDTFDRLASTGPVPGRIRRASTLFKYYPPAIFGLRKLTDQRLAFLKESIPSTTFNSKQLNKILHTELDRTSRRYPLGSSSENGNLLFLILQGARNCFLPGILAALVSLVFGTALGIISAYPKSSGLRAFGRFVSQTLLSLPRILYLLVVAAVFHFNIYPIMTVLGILHAPRLARLLTDQIQILKQQQFIESGRELSLSDFTLIFKHILFYHCLYLYVIQTAFCMADAIFTETMLSFLGFSPGTTSWGHLFSQGIEFLGTGCHWMWIFPLLAIITTIGGFHLTANSALNLQQIRNQN